MKITVYKDLKNLLQLEGDVNKLILPSSNISLFLVHKLNKFSLKEVEYKELLKLEQKHKVPKFKYPGISKIFLKPDGFEKEVLFNYAIKNYEEVSMEIETYLKFIEFCENKSIVIDEIEFMDVSKFDIVDKQVDIISNYIDLNDLDKLLKLFCFFYHKEISKKTLSKISKFQENLLSMNLDLSEFIAIYNILIEYSKNREQRTLEDKIIETIYMSIKIIESEMYDEFVQEISFNQNYLDSERERLLSHLG